MGSAVWLATGGWIGLAPWAPGTFGSLWGVVLAWSIAQIPSLWIQVAVIVAVCGVGVPLCTAAARRMGGKKDPGSIVWDEIAAVPITFFLVPVQAMSSLWVLAAGFLLFRVMDIAKPPPARQIEQLPDGLGVMADDWIAGVYSCLVLHGLLWWGVLP